MPRGARLDTPGTLHHVIVRGIERRNIVDDDLDRENLVTRIGRVAAETQTAIYAWVLMSNHAHILMRSGAGGVALFMRRILTGHAVSYNRRHRPLNVPQKTWAALKRQFDNTKKSQDNARSQIKIGNVA